MTSHSDHLAHVDSGSMPDLATLAVGGPQAGWVVIDAARNSRFTGEIAFRHDPAISVFFDNGLAYHAVRDGDPSLCDRLIEEGVVDPTQVERGVIRVGSVENLGRLFDRDPSIDRDAVLVVMEMATDEAITAIANAPATTFVPTAYRHHVSGVHRWFVGPNAPTQLTPVGEVSQIDASVTSRLPGTSAERTALQILDVDDDVQIEWDDPSEFDGELSADSADDGILQSILADDAAARETESRRARAAEQEAERSAHERANRAADERAERLARDRFERLADEHITLLADDRTARAAAAGFDPDTADWTQPMAVSTEVATTSITSGVQPPVDPDVSSFDAPLVGPSTTPPDDTEFQITWPDGTAHAVRDASTDVAAGPVDRADPAPAPLAEPIGDMPEEPTVRHGLLDVQPASDASETPALASVLDQLALDDQPEAVQDAVQRALDAIQSAAAPELASPPALHLVDTPAPVVEPPVSGNPVDIAPARHTSPPPTVEDHAAAPAGFAPPTLESSAEAMYARAEEASPASSEPSVVFVDDSDGDRAGALRRLIGSIRRK